MNFEKIKSYFTNFDPNTFFSSLFSTLVTMNTEGIVQLVTLLIAVGGFIHNMRIAKARQELEAKRLESESKKVDVEIRKMEAEAKQAELNNERFSIETESLKLKNERENDEHSK